MSTIWSATGSLGGGVRRAMVLLGARQAHIVADACPDRVDRRAGAA
jgi:hypothetical protein